jgi:hypothetical protein
MSLYYYYHSKLYKNFRTGLTFAQVEDILYRDFKIVAERFNTYKFITRHTILGRWREIKLTMFNNTYTTDYFNNVTEIEMEQYLNLTRKETNQVCKPDNYNNSEFIF